jgi:hypothetical protein
MNERIHKLAQQAFDQVNDGTIADIKIPREFIDQFARLIVRECAQLADCPNSFKHRSGGKILRHFGVKETA